MMYHNNNILLWHIWVLLRVSCGFNTFDSSSLHKDLTKELVKSAQWCWRSSCRQVGRGTSSKMDKQVIVIIVINACYEYININKHRSYIISDQIRCINHWKNISSKSERKMSCLLGNTWTNTRSKNSIYGNIICLQIE